MYVHYCIPHNIRTIINPQHSPLPQKKLEQSPYQIKCASTFIYLPTYIKIGMKVYHYISHNIITITYLQHYLKFIQTMPVLIKLFDLFHFSLNHLKACIEIHNYIPQSFGITMYWRHTPFLHKLQTISVVIKLI